MLSKPSLISSRCRKHGHTMLLQCVYRRPPEFSHGTLVEVNGWWPEGNPNSGFVRKLVSYGKNEIRRQIGRRYATILLQDKVRILVQWGCMRAF